MSGDIDNTDASATGKVKVREPQIDGHPATLLFFEPIRVNAGQRLHERTLPVIDVARRPNHEMPHHLVTLSFELT
jgi:hypothetical protein